MKATDDLREEHRNIKRMLDVADEIAGHLGDGRAVPDADLQDVFEYMRVVVDKCHHGKEEAMLFPTLVQSGMGRELHEEIESLLADHQAGRELIKEASIAEQRRAQAETSGAEPKREESAVASTLQSFVNLLCRHIVQEEGIVFARADELPLETQDVLQQSYDRIERDVIGPGVHEQLHETLHRLEAAYPKSVRSGG